MRISTCRSKVRGGRSHLIGVGRIHKVVQELLLQCEELIVGEVFLLVVVAHDNILGLCLVV